MPRFQYRFDAKNIEVNETFPTPKNVTELNAWLRACSDKAEQVPARFRQGKLYMHPGWAMEDAEINSRTIAFRFRHSDGHKSVLIIDRKFDEFSR